MMENEMTLSAVPGTAADTVLAPPALIPPHERPEAPLLHKGFLDLFRLNVASLIINVLSNALKLDEHIPVLRYPLSTASMVISVLMLITLWKMSAAVPRFRKAVYWDLAPLAVTPLLMWVNAVGVVETVGEESADMLLALLGVMLLALMLVSAAAHYQQLTACAEAFDGSDEVFAGKWRKLCTWMVALMVLLGVLAALAILLIRSQGPFFYLSGGMVLLFAMLAIAVGFAVTSVVELVYQNRAARLFE